MKEKQCVFADSSVSHIQLLLYIFPFTTRIQPIHQGPFLLRNTCVGKSQVLPRRLVEMNLSVGTWQSRCLGPSKVADFTPVPTSVIFLEHSDGRCSCHIYCCWLERRSCCCGQLLGIVCSGFACDACKLTLAFTGGDCHRLENTAQPRNDTFSSLPSS